MSNSSITKGVMRWLQGLSVAAVCCLGASAAPPAPLASPEVLTFKLSYSNVHLIRSEPPVLIDAGSPADWPSLTQQLQAHDIKPCDIRRVIITHAHQDHAGLASKFKQSCGSRTQIVMHQRDTQIAAAGGFDPDLKFTQWTSRIVWLLVNYTYEPFKPDVSWDTAPGQSISLASLGLAGRAVSVPGHTPGSLAILLDDGRAFVGDMLAGGYFGGAIQPAKASEHYFHGDSARNYNSLSNLLGMGAHTFYIGHGGPLPRESVVQAVRKLESKTHSDTPIHAPSVSPSSSFSSTSSIKVSP
jgi:hydroxyacylglutathione hydrolase